MPAVYYHVVQGSSDRTLLRWHDKAGFVPHKSAHSPVLRTWTGNGGLSIIYNLVARQTNSVRAEQHQAAYARNNEWQHVRACRWARVTASWAIRDW